MSDDTALVFADLADAFSALEAARGSPKQVRREFSRFVGLTQRLTAAMRKDFSAHHGGAWVASDFPGWNGVTELFKVLRNEEEHQHPIFLSVHERRFYLLPGQPNQLFPFEGTWVLSDQLTDSPIGGAINFYPNDPASGQATEPVAPVRIEYQYLVQPRTEAISKRLQAIGTTDMHVLSKTCLATLSDYYEYFRLQIEQPG